MATDPFLPRSVFWTLAVMENPEAATHQTAGIMLMKTSVVPDLFKAHDKHISIFLNRLNLAKAANVAPANMTNTQTISCFNVTFFISK